MPEKLPEYDKMDRPHRSSFVRPCIDGSKQGSNLCLGYCHFEEHPGFLTEKLMRKHRCLEKGCLYFVPKPAKKRDRSPLPAHDYSGIVETANKALAALEGLRVIRAELDEKDEWVLHYAAIAEYHPEKYAGKLGKLLARKVRFKNLHYPYEKAAALIFK